MQTEMTENQKRLNWFLDYLKCLQEHLDGAVCCVRLGDVFCPKTNEILCCLSVVVKRTIEQAIENLNADMRIRRWWKKIGICNIELSYPLADIGAGSIKGILFNNCVIELCFQLRDSGETQHIRVANIVRITTDS